jgi:hypothetical protein
MVFTIIAVVMILVAFPLAVLAAYAVEERTESPTGAPTSPIAE